MFRNMRRKKQQLEKEAAIHILEKASSGVLALLGDDDYPYAVPLSYVYEKGKIFFHSAKNGHKIDAAKQHAKASFCVVSQDHVVPDEYTTYFQSVIAFGKIHLLENEQEKWTAVEKLAEKYHPKDNSLHRRQAIEKDWQAMTIMVLEIEHITGKQAVELLV